MQLWRGLSRLVSAALVAAMPASAQSPPPHEEAREVKADVLKVEAVRVRAMLEGDVETLDRITGADYVHVESSGQARTKREFLQGFVNGEYRFRSFVIDESQLNMLGSVAVVTGRYHNVIETPAGVQPVKYARHIRIYALRDGRWVNVAHQATELPSPSQ